MIEILTPEQILAMSLADTPKEVALPEGHWRLKVLAAPVIRSVERDNPNAPIGEMSVPVKPVAAGDDVNETEAANFTASEARVFYRIPLYNFGTDLNKIVRFVQVLGVDTKSGTYADWFKLAKGGEFVSESKHRQNKQDPDGLPF